MRLANYNQIANFALFESSDNSAISDRAPADYCPSFISRRGGSIPELNLVAEADGKLVGHVMCERGKIVSDGGTEHEILTFGPLCVSPALQRGGIGAAPIEEVPRPEATPGAETPTS